MIEHFYSPRVVTLTDTITPSQSEPKNNGNEGVLHIHQSSRFRASPSDAVVSYSGYPTISTHVLEFMFSQLL